VHKGKGEVCLVK